MLRLHVFLFAAAMPLTAIAAWPDPNLLNLLNVLKPQPTSVPVAASATTEVKDGHLLLNFHVTNVSNEPLTFTAWELPWGHPDSIRYIALNMDGSVVPGAAVMYDLCCDTLANISIAPTKSLDGTYDLAQHLNQKAVPKDADLLIMWVWRVRTGDGGKVDRGTASGIAWIHTPK